MSREFDFSRLLAGYSGLAVLPRRVTPGIVIAAVDVFAVVVGLTAMHFGGAMWSATQPAPAAPSLISPVNAAEATSGVPDPHLRPLVAAVRLPVTPGASILFAAPLVTAAYYAGDAGFMPMGSSWSSSTPPERTASADPITIDPVIEPASPQAVPPIAKLADIAITGHVAQHAIAAAADATLDNLLLSRGSAAASNGGRAGSAGALVAANAGLANTSATVAANTGDGPLPSVSVGANVEVASAAPVVSSATNAVGSAASHTVGGVANVVRGLLN